MRTYIGKLLPDGQVKYIEVNYCNGAHGMTLCLNNFYKSEKRTDDLLNLGDLHALGPSPYGKSTGCGDEVHCRAQIRDYGGKAKDNRATVCASKEEFLAMKSNTYLYQDGCWLFSPDNGNPLTGLTLKELDEKGEFNPYDINKFRTWKEMEAKAIEEKAVFFVYRKTRLVAAINQARQIIN